MKLFKMIGQTINKKKIFTWWTNSNLKTDPGTRF